MAKRSKKKNPNALSKQQKEDILFNQSLDGKKSKLDLKLNITLGIVIGVFFLSFLILPTLNMNFTSTLSELSGQVVEEDADFSVTIDMSFLSFLTAGAGGYTDAVQYLADHTGTGLDMSIIYPMFMKKLTAQAVQPLNSVYVFILILSIIAVISWIILTAVTCKYRKKNRDGKFMLISVAVFCALCIAQWLVFIAVGIASADKGQIQPHIASYLIMGCGVALATVYGVYKSKVNKLNAQRRKIAEQNSKGEKV